MKTGVLFVLLVVLLGCNLFLIYSLSTVMQSHDETLSKCISREEVTRVLTPMLEKRWDREEYYVSSELDDVKKSIHKIHLEIAKDKGIMEGINKEPASAESHKRYGLYSRSVERSEEVLVKLGERQLKLEAELTMLKEVQNDPNQLLAIVLEGGFKRGFGL